MYKFFLYTVLVILYLGLAKALSPSELGVQYLQNERGFSKLVRNTNSTFILIDTHATGFLIKTYYQKYRVISGYDNVEEIILRTSKEFAKRNRHNIGLSIYRQVETTSGMKEEFTPQPPGGLYIGNREFGYWRENKEGKTVWKFFKTFKNFPKYLGWGKFRPDPEFLQMMKMKNSNNEAFHGLNGEFGTEGKVTRQAFPHLFREERMKKVEMKTLLIEYFKENF